MDRCTGVPGYPPWTDLSNHGTWVASIAASKGLIVAGVTSRTTLMALSTGSGLASCGSGFGFLAQTIRAIVYAADHGADVINMSFRGRDALAQGGPDRSLPLCHTRRPAQIRSAIESSADDLGKRESVPSTAAAASTSLGLSGFLRHSQAPQSIAGAQSSRWASSAPTP